MSIISDEAFKANPEQALIEGLKILVEIAKSGDTRALSEGFSRIPEKVQDHDLSELLQKP